MKQIQSFMLTAAFGREAIQHEALCFVLSHITWWNNFAAVKIHEEVGKELKGPKDKVCGS